MELITVVNRMKEIEGSPLYIIKRNMIADMIGEINDKIKSIENQDDFMFTVDKETMEELLDDKIVELSNVNFTSVIIKDKNDKENSLSALVEIEIILSLLHYALGNSRLVSYLENELNTLKVLTLSVIATKMELKIL